MTYNEIHVHNI